MGNGEGAMEWKDEMSGMNMECCILLYCIVLYHSLERVLISRRVILQSIELEDLYTLRTTTCMVGKIKMHIIFIYTEYKRYVCQTTGYLMLLSIIHPSID